MQESLLTLLNLQEIDLQIDQLLHAKKDYPGRISTLKCAIEQADESVLRKEEKLNELDKQHRHFERELSATTEDLKKHRDRFSEVKTNREYDAVQTEIDACQKKIGDCETQVLTIMADHDDLQKELENERQTVSRLRAEKTLEIDELTGLLGSVDGEIRTHEMKRRVLLSKINSRIMAMYDRIRKAKRGTAVVALVRGACGGCYQHIPPQRLSEVKRNNKIITCESCGRLLVWIEDTESLS